MTNDERNPKCEIRNMNRFEVGIRHSFVIWHLAFVIFTARHALQLPTIDASLPEIIP